MQLVYDRGRDECGYCKMGNMPHTLDEHNLSRVDGAVVNNLFTRPQQYQPAIREPKGGLRAMRKRGEL